MSARRFHEAATQIERDYGDVMNVIVRHGAGDGGLIVMEDAEQVCVMRYGADGLLLAVDPPVFKGGA
jgi:hypothetical protein